MSSKKIIKKLENFKNMLKKIRKDSYIVKVNSVIVLVVGSQPIILNEKLIDRLDSINSINDFLDYISKVQKNEI